MKTALFLITLILTVIFAFFFVSQSSYALNPPLTNAFTTCPNGSGSGTSISCAITINNKYDLIVIGFGITDCGGTPSVSTITDTQGNTINTILGHFVSQVGVDSWYFNASASGADTISITYGTGPAALYVYELSNLYVKTSDLLNTNFADGINAIATTTGFSSTPPSNSFVFGILADCSATSINSVEGILDGSEFSISNIDNGIQSLLTSGSNFHGTFNLGTSPTWTDEILGFKTTFIPSTTITETAWNVPASTGLLSSVEFLLALLVPTMIFLTLSLRTKNPDSYITLMLVGLTFGSVIGVLTNFIPFTLVFLFAGFLAIYLWKGRSRGEGAGIM